MSTSASQWKKTPLRDLPPLTPTSAAQMEGLKNTRALIQDYMSGKLTHQEFLRVTKSRKLNYRASMQEIEEIGNARMKAIDTLNAEREAAELFAEYFDSLPPSSNPVKVENDPVLSEEEQDHDNSYDLHEDGHERCARCNHGHGKAKCLAKQPPRPKTPEPPKKTYNLRDRKTISKPKRYESYGEFVSSADQDRPKREYYSAVVNAPQPSTSTVTEPAMLHMCSHRISTGPNTVDFVIHVKGYNPSNDEPITIRIN